MTKICIVTACGNKKHEIPKPAWKIYKSSRIKAVYNRRNNHDMYILSAEHGLLPSEKIIQPYNRIMDEQRSKELISDMVPIIQKYDTVIFFKAGARKLYEQCIESACKKADKKIISFGYAIMGDINKLPEIIRDASRDTQPMPDNCKILHELLERLPLIKYPFDADRLPDNGIYFFYEHGEFQAHTSKPRIVRVGTHNQNNFKSRIRDHYVSDSKMNFDSNRSPPHDRSIFRKNIGRAMLNV